MLQDFNVFTVSNTTAAPLTFVYTYDELAVTAPPINSAVGNPKEKIRIEPLEEPVPQSAPAPVEKPQPVEKEPVGV